MAADDHTKLTVDDAWDHYYAMSGSTSNSARQLAFAGIAVVWILATDNQVVPVEQGDLRLPIIMFVIVLALDLFQYLLATGKYWTFARGQEEKKELEFDEFPRSLNKPSEFVFILKILAIIYGYILIFGLLGGELFKAPASLVTPHTAYAL